MFEFEYKGGKEESVSPVLLLRLLKDKGIDKEKVKFYRNRKLISLADFNYYLNIYQNTI